VSPVRGTRPRLHTIPAEAHGRAASGRFLRIGPQQQTPRGGAGCRSPSISIPREMKRFPAVNPGCSNGVARRGLVTAFPALHKSSARRSSTCTVFRRVGRIMSDGLRAPGALKISKISSIRRMAVDHRAKAARTFAIRKTPVNQENFHR